MGARGTGLVRRHAGDGHRAGPEPIRTEPLPEALRRVTTARRDLYGGRAER
ncbi:hypothetical protein ACFVW1_22400 [Streptomyces olivochromogenes]|uniref:hypothetical protein n=1 Tax=Streptomyces olivochromogenes TaxID=1963 RepID=UPI0036DE906A